jgi:uncharacterized protein YndB with AHSA1/START domain
MAKEQSVSASRLIQVPPEVIFAILVNPARHVEIDGSGTVRGSKEASPEPLKMGSKFGMKMKLVLPYDMRSTVVEFEENRLIAWAHFGKHRWRYELEEVDGGTMVTETFDWSTALSPKFLELMGYPKKSRPAIQKTLERLEAVAIAAT